jgi:hypothetical protein
MIYSYLFPHLAAQTNPLEKEYWGGYKYKPLEMSDQDFLDTVKAYKEQRSRGGRRMSRRRKQRMFRRSRRASSRSRK